MVVHIPWGWKNTNKYSATQVACGALMKQDASAPCLPSLSHERTSAMDGAFAEEDDIARLGLWLHNHAAQVVVAGAVNQRRRRGEVCLVATGDGNKAT